MSVHDKKAANNDTILDQIDRARIAGTPLLYISTSDQNNLFNKIKTFLDVDNKKQKISAPIIRWDAKQGFIGIGDEGKSCVAQMTGDDNIYDPDDAIMALSAMSKFGVCVMFNMHRYIEHALVTASFMNIRDYFKSTNKMIIALAPNCSLPEEIKHDFTILEEEYPTEDELKEMVHELHDAAEFTQPETSKLKEITNMLTALSPFSAEQTLAMSMSPKIEAVNLEVLWNYKKTAIKQIRGLEYDDAQVTLADIGGLSAFKNKLTRLCNGKRRPSYFIRIEELEKAMSGSSSSHGDNTGVSQGILQVILSAMEDYNWRGCIAVGHPGVGKSYCCKAAGNDFGIKTFIQDIGSTKDGELGKSEKLIREQIKGLKTLGGADIFFVASVNELQSLSPALLRRYRSGIYFFDLPTAEERRSIWGIHLYKNGFLTLEESKNEKIVADFVGLELGRRPYTGAEIRNICETAWEEDITILQSAQTSYSPIYISDAEGVQRLRKFAHNRFFSASYEGLYQYDASTDLTNNEEETMPRRSFGKK